MICTGEGRNILSATKCDKNTGMLLKTLRRDFRTLSSLFGLQEHTKIYL